MLQESRCHLLSRHENRHLRAESVERALDPAVTGHQAKPDQGSGNGSRRVAFRRFKKFTQNGGVECCSSGLEPYELLPFAGDAAEHYADIRGRLEKKGKVIGPAYLIIATTARATGAVLVTHNTKEFSRVPGLQIEDWTK